MWIAEHHSFAIMAPQSFIICVMLVKYLCAKKIILLCPKYKQQIQTVQIYAII